LNKFSDAKNVITVKREGEVREINIDDLKVGDIARIKTGMNIPVDAILLPPSSGVTSDESAMTGESIELKKDTMELTLVRKDEHEADEKEGDQANRDSHTLPSPLLLSGTQIQTGEGWFLVIVVGKNSCVGKIRDKLEQGGAEMTPLQEKLEAIATDIGKLGMVSAYITVMVLFLRFWIEQGYAGYDWGSNVGTFLGNWFGYLIVGVTIIVVAVPEGLPLAVMISLAYSVRKMLKDMNFVKRLSSCEIMGGANNICSDKTGTLTMNKMHVTNVWHGINSDLPQPVDAKPEEIEEENPEEEKKKKKKTKKSKKGKELEDRRKQELPPFSLGDYFKDQKHGDLFVQALACNTQGEIENAGATDKAMIEVIPRTGNDYMAIRDTHLEKNFIRF
jgi:magnesium-transporting ATPase (P-type)